MRLSCIGVGHFAHHLGAIVHREQKGFVEHAVGEFLDLDTLPCSNRLRGELGQFVHVELDMTHCHFVLFVGHKSASCVVEEVIASIPIIGKRTAGVDPS